MNNAVNNTSNVAQQYNYGSQNNNSNASNKSLNNVSYTSQQQKGPRRSGSILYWGQNQNAVPDEEVSCSMNGHCLVDMGCDKVVVSASGAWS